MLRWIIFAAVAWIAYLVRMQLPPFIAGAVLAYMLNRPVNALGRYIGRGLSVLVIYLLALGSVGFVISHFAPQLAEQLVGLFNNRQQIIENMVAQVGALTGWQLDVAQVMAAVTEKIQGFVAEKPAEILELGHLITHSFLSLVICLVTSIYMVLDGEKLGHFALRFVPEARREEVSQMAAEIDGKLGKYILGQVFLIAIMSIFAFLVLSLNHVHYALLLAVFVGVMEILPFFGPILALGVVFLVVGAQSGLPTTGVVLAVLYAGRIVEDYVVVPRVVGQAVHLSPLVTIFAVISGETIGGGLGMLLSIPAAAAIKVVLDKLLPPLKVESEEVAKVTRRKVECERCLAIRAQLFARLKTLWGYLKWRRG